MGRAQVLQALACGLAPDVRMNPVLLKPTSQIGSQVLVLGRPVGQMRVAQYLEYKPRAWRAVCRAYRELAADRDVLVLEGSGQPGGNQFARPRYRQYAYGPLCRGACGPGGGYRPGWSFCGSGGYPGSAHPRGQGARCRAYSQ